MTALGALLVAQALHGGLSLGVGTAYDGAGVRLELGSEHFGAFVGTGALPALSLTGSQGGGGWGLSTGLRWYSDVRSGLLVSLNLTDAWLYECADFDFCVAGARTRHFSFFTLTAVVGYRWKFDFAFLEAGIGGGMFRDTSVGPTPDYRAIPDLVLGVGFDI